MFTRYRKRTIVGITVQMFAQLNGINIVSFYLPSTLASAGFDNRKSLLFTAANAIPYTAATIVTWWLADKWGRKPLLILGGEFQVPNSCFEESTNHTFPTRSRHGNPPRRRLRFHTSQP